MYTSDLPSNYKIKLIRDQTRIGYRLLGSDATEHSGNINNSNENDDSPTKDTKNKIEHKQGTNNNKRYKENPVESLSKSIICLHHKTIDDS